MERVAEKVIKMIEEQAHTSGLTDRVREMLSELLGKEASEDEEKGFEEDEIASEHEFRGNPSKNISSPKYL